ncbi:MAG: aminotransferase class I/II-fold pyridoxal phosphate-dependent enzyme [Luteitalea sp.]|nr:aminotransferase class I/II-fold pyridoxal phosphate-dependent enzyme [Luteitalea sp.]
MPPTTTAPAVAVADRVSAFTYAIRNIVAEAKRVEATGTRVRYLNIGDPIPFGFRTPAHLVDAVGRAVRANDNGYAPSSGLWRAREAVAADFTRRHLPTDADRVIITNGTSEGIELALTALVNAGDEVLMPVPTYPLYTAVTAKLGARAVLYPADPEHDWLPDVEALGRLITRRTRALVVIDPNNPTGAVYSDRIRRHLLDLSDHHGLPILSDEVYGDLAYDGPVAPLGSLNPDALILSFSSLSKAYLAPGWRAGWLAVGRSPRLDPVVAAIQKLADGRLCSSGPMQYAIAPALTGDRSHQEAFCAALRVRAELTTRRLNAISGMRCVQPRGAFYAMPRVELPPGASDEDFVLGLLRDTGILCVHGSGFGLPREDGFFRVVYLASPEELSTIYDLMADFTDRFLREGRRA